MLESLTSGKCDENDRVMRIFGPGDSKWGAGPCAPLGASNLWDSDFDARRNEMPQPHFQVKQSRLRALRSKANTDVGGAETRERPCNQLQKLQALWANSP